MSNLEPTIKIDSEESLLRFLDSDGSLANEHYRPRRSLSSPAANLLSFHHLHDEDDLPQIPKPKGHFLNDISTFNSHLSCQTLGDHPKPDCSQFHVRRKDPYTRDIRTVPAMVFNAEANRAAVPEHQLLEDDWRAYRSVLHNGLRLGGRITLRPTDRHEKLEVDTYINAVPSPYGYMYRSVTDSQSEAARESKKIQQQQQQQAVRPVAATLPVIDTTDPLKKYHVQQEGLRMNTCKTGKFNKVFDVGTIFVPGLKDNITIYNEPDSVPQSVAQVNFRQPLPERTEHEVGVHRNLGDRDTRKRIGAVRFELPTKAVNGLDKEPKSGCRFNFHSHVEQLYKNKKLQLFEQSKKKLDVNRLKKMDK